jgi:hypothetical protein
MSSGWAAWVLVILPGAVYAVLVWAYLQGSYLRRMRTMELAQQAKDAYQKLLPEAQAWGRLAELRAAPYLYPLALCMLVATAFSAISVVKAGMTLRLYEDWVKLIQTKIWGNALAGFWGAYVWGLYDCLTRFRSRSWTANSLHFTWLRLLVGPALGALAGYPFAKEYSPLVAFGLGSFPTDTLRRWLRDYVGQRLKISGEADVPVRPAWTTIQGLNPEVIERLAEADITSPCHLACAEPVGLHNKTNIEWRTLLDLIDQAILAIYLEGALEKLRPLGIRGAIEMAILWSRGDQSGDMVRQLAKALGQEEATVKNLLQNLYEDAQVNVIWALWFKE